MKPSINNQPETSAAPRVALTPAPAGLVQRKCACGGSSGVGGDCEECNQKRLSVQRFPADGKSLATLQESLTASPSRFGHNLGKVRIHNHVPQCAQAKLNVNEPGDRFEQEADRVAEQVTRGLYAPPSPAEPAPPSDNIEQAGRESEDVEGDGSDQEGSAPETESAPAEPAPMEAEPEAEPEAETEAEPASTGEAASSGLLVEDDAQELLPGQLRKSAFLDQLRSSVCSTAEAVLSAVGRTAEGCPYIEGWIAYYRTRSSQQIERAIRRYAPEAADVRSASDYMPIINSRIRQGVMIWATTGQITGVPEELQGQVAAPNAGEPASGTAGEGRKVIRRFEKLFFKSREGGPRDADPEHIQSQLNSGQPLQGDVRSRMESAFGHDFSRVRVHTDSNAAALASGVNARAFTIGKDIAFGAGEYQPGNLIGDALLAHELAHVVQQGDANPSTEMMQKGGSDYNALEEDADNSAVGAVVSMWGGAKAGLADIARNAMPRLKSGLRLSRCGRNTPPPPQANCCCCPTSITIQNITQIDTPERMGHSFNTLFGLAYTGSGTKQSCSLLWEERSNIPYTSTMVANTWHDMTADPETSGSFAASWARRTEPCPGTETVTDTDPPSLGKRPGRTATRKLEFRITVTSGSGCTCAHPSLQIQAVQTLAMINAAPDWANSSFPQPTAVP